MKFFLFSLLFIFNFSVFPNIAKIYKHTGKFNIFRENGKVLFPVSNNIENLDIVKTYKNSTLNIKYKDKILVDLNLKENTEVLFSTYILNGSKIYVVDLYLGEVEVKCNFIPKAYKFFIRTNKDLITAGDKTSKFSVISSGAPGTYMVLTELGTSWVTPYQKQTKNLEKIKPKIYYSNPGSFLEKKEGLLKNSNYQIELPYTAIEIWKKNTELETSKKIFNKLIQNYDKYLQIKKDFLKEYNAMYENIPILKSWFKEYQSSSLLKNFDKTKSKRKMLKTNMDKIYQLANELESYLVKLNYLQNYFINYFSPYLDLELKIKNKIDLDRIIINKKIWQTMYLVKIYAKLNTNYLNI